MSSAPAQVIELHHIAARVGVTTILKDVSLSVQSGEAVGLFGPNGAGKTTLLRLVATLHRPANGTATVLGADLDGSDRYDIRSQIGLIGHVPSLYPELSLRENLEFVANVAGIGPGALDTALEQVGLTGAADRKAGVCSYGMQRRAEFAREMMRAPMLLLLDEPHSALDGSALGIVEHLVRRVCDRGGGAVLVSHDRERVEKLTDRTVELTGGVLE